MTMKFKTMLPLLALMLCLGAFLFPVTAHAQTADTTPPTLTATLSGDTLTATAKDSDSGVDSIHVGKHRFATLADGTARLRFKDYAGTTDKQVEVYATDVAGNRSTSVLIDNPYYVAPVTQTPAPVTSTPTPAPTSTPAPSFSPIPTPVPSSDPTPTERPDPTPTTELPEPQPPTEEAIPDGSNPLTPNGGGTVQDNATEQEGKEFFTVTTAAGNVYYLIIDRQRGTENVYFLSPVTEEDLLGLADGSAVISPSPAQPEPQTPTPSSSETPEPQQPAQSGGMNMGTILFILLAIAAVGGAAYYIKIVKPRKQAADEEEYEEDWEDEEPGEDEYFFDGEDNANTQDSEEK